MNPYDTHLTDAQWQIIKKFFDCERKRRHRLEDIWNGILYVVKTGCQWRMLPKGFAPWQTVYYYFRTWKYAGIIENILEELVYRIRSKHKRKASPTVCIIDSQSVKTTSVGGFAIGYDAGKKIKGRKRHIATDTLGNLLAVEVHSASLSDREKGLSIVKQAKQKHPTIKKAFADGGYSGALIETMEKELNCELEIVKKWERKFRVLPKRWIVERTFAWLANDRRNSKDYEFTPLSSETMAQLSFIKTALNKLFK
jgi:putative transposase